MHTHWALSGTFTLAMGLILNAMLLPGMSYTVTNNTTNYKLRLHRLVKSP